MEVLSLSSPMVRARLCGVQTRWRSDLGVCFASLTSACRCAESGRHSSTGQGPPWAPRGFTRPAAGSCCWSFPCRQSGRASAPQAPQPRGLTAAGSLSAPAGVPEHAGRRASVFNGVSVRALRTQAASECCALRVLVFSGPSCVDLSGLSPALNQASPQLGQPSTFHS